jgi:pyruvate dehydrogenase E2 component (dihydrolipoamide acetyltransferase)
MPKFNMSMTIGLVAKWFKREGEYVTQGEPLCEIEGDKATMELESPADGVLLKIVVPEGQESRILKSIGFIGKPEDNFQEELDKESESPSETEPTTVPLPTKPTATPAPVGRTRINASPVAKRLALEMNIDLSTITGTGAEGLISREDVLKTKESQNSPQPKASHIKAVVKLSGIKKITAERMRESYLDAPHFSLTISVNMQAAVNLHEKSSNAVHITYTDILVYSVSRCLTTHDYLNSTLQGDEINILADINIGIASATEKGLIVPVIKQAERKSLNEIASERQRLADLSKEGKISAEDLSEGTFTITNLGMYGVESFSPIIFPGQACILGVGSIIPTPIWNESGELISAPMMKLTLVCDHRIIDGVDAGNFLKDLKILIENIKID